MDKHDKHTELSEELAKEVKAHVREGSSTEAKRAFSRAWRDAVPELPLRFSVILDKPSAEAVTKMVQRSRQTGAPPELRFRRVSDRQVEVTALHARAALGVLPKQDAQLLSELGSEAKIYRPQLLEINNNSDGTLNYIAIEVVRPETRYCSSCGKKHAGEHINCDQCRQKRRRKGEETPEHTSLSFHEAVDAIISEHKDDDGEII
jgi:hypothetical protein